MQPKLNSQLNEASSAPAVKLTDVSLSYEDAPPVLHDLNLDVAEGAFRYLVGPSGVGKSSLLRLIFLDASPTKGDVALFGESIGDASHASRAALRRKVGVVFQDFRLLDGLSLIDNIALPRLITGADVADARDEAKELIDWVGLNDRIDAAPTALSGGERQRAAIARAIIGRPSLIVADEPTGSVDDAMADRLITLFEELNRQGTAVILATHSIALINRFPHPTLRLGDGNVQMELD